MQVGTDTTANVISFAVFLLATHPQVEAKVVAEIQALSKAYPPTSIANLEKYTYTSMVRGPCTGGCGFGVAHTLEFLRHMLAGYKSGSARGST